MEINYYAVLACGVFSMILGSIWYGPLFGKKWMMTMGIDPNDEAKKQEMKKKAGPLYATQFVLTLFQAYVLAFYIAGWQDASGVENALWIWAAFVTPTIAGGLMWTTMPKSHKWSLFLIGAGYQLVLFIGFGLILGLWK